MSRAGISFLVALALSLAFHASLLLPWAVNAPQTSPPPLQIDILVAPDHEKKLFDQASQAKLRAKSTIPTHPNEAKEETARVADSTPPTLTAEKKLASLAAPPPPSAEEWKLASTYTPRNSKRYRHNWGQQVRSMMGTAVEGPDQGQVRLRIEIAPDGKVAKVETLWTTSQLAEKLALDAIRSLPPLPPTPTGKPLIFEQTISFEPFETGWPPSYKLDCLPEPLPFRNPFVWDGSSPQQALREQPSHRPPPSADCITDSTSDSIDKEEADMKRQMDQWRWGR